MKKGCASGKKYRSGGRVHSDAAEDKAMIKSMVKPSSLRASGGRIEGGAAKRRLDRPGPKKSSGKVNVNVIVAKGGGKPEPDGDEMPMPMAKPPMPPPGLAGPPPMRKNGGRISASPESGVGRMQLGKMARKS